MNDQNTQAVPYIVTESARIDADRLRRRGLPEVIYCEGKTPEQTQDAFAGLRQAGQVALGTRASESHFEHIRATMPQVAYDPASRLLLWHPELDAESAGRLLTANSPNSLAENDDSPLATNLHMMPYVAAVSAGTADAAVLSEAIGTLNVFNVPVRVVYDAGVAGIHRILDQVDMLNGAAVIIVVAGMDGALPSVVAGLVNTPIIAVPTSVGYGANFGGLAPLLAMLNNCAGGVTVTNIDNGFGAAYTASLIMRKMDPDREVVPDAADH